MLEYVPFFFFWGGEGEGAFLGERRNLRAPGVRAAGWRVDRGVFLADGRIIDIIHTYIGCSTQASRAKGSVASTLAPAVPPLGLGKKSRSEEVRKDSL